MSLADQKLSIGLLMLPYFAWIDAAGPVDYLNNHSQAMMKLLQFPQSIIDKCPLIEWHYISHDLSPIIPACGPPQVPTCTYTTAPHLDCIIVPATDPCIILPEGCPEFLKSRFSQLKALFAVDTGSMAISSTGLLDGLRVCSNKTALREIAKQKKLNLNVKWVCDRHWIVDGKVWSGTGIAGGIDIAAEFARVHFDPEVVGMVKAVCEYTPKPDQPDEWAATMDGIDLYN